MIDIMKPEMRSAIAAGYAEFWRLHDSRSPRSVGDADRLFVNECLLMAFLACGTPSGKSPPALAWTSEPPKVAGWYASNRRADQEQDLVYIWRPGQDWQSSYDWYGPIPEPPA